MTKKYTHLQLEQRYQIEVLLRTGKSKSAIALALGVDRSTIYRELKRNAPVRGRGYFKYSPRAAQKRSQDRHRLKPKHSLFTDSMKATVRRWLTYERWSPELISAKGRELYKEFVSHESIYQWIWDCKKSHSAKTLADSKLYKYLRHGRRRRKRGNLKSCRGIIHGRVSIEQRPQIINLRKRLGDKEADIVLGKNHKPGLLVLTDRKTRMSWIEKIRTKEAYYIECKIKKILNRSLHNVKSITFDNDQAFTNHVNLRSKLKIKTYFTHPYTSQEKGTVENRIGVIRRFFPKKTDFTKISAQEVLRVEQLINSRPLRMFKYKSAKEVYESLIV